MTNWNLNSFFDEEEEGFEEDIELGLADTEDEEDLEDDDFEDEEDEEEIDEEEDDDFIE